MNNFTIFLQTSARREFSDIYSSSVGREFLRGKGVKRRVITNFISSIILLTIAAKITNIMTSL